MKPAAVVLLTAAVAAVAFGVGRATAPTTDAPPTRVPETGIGDQGPGTRGQGEETEVPRETVREVPPPLESEIADLPTPEDVDGLLEALETMERDEDIDEWGADMMAQWLMGDPDLLRATLERWRQSPDPRLTIALGLVHDPLVEQAALDLARVGGTRDARLAGLELLDRLDTGNPDVVTEVRGILDRESDPQITSAALYALHRDAPAPAVASAVNAVLARLRGHTDETVRSRAVIASAEWGDTPAPVLAALGDGSPSVRAAAAFALGMHRFPSPDVSRALAERVADSTEDWAVREAAWRSLGRYPLDEAGHRAVMQFRAEWERANP